jgi:hypothetical protein
LFSRRWRNADQAERVCLRGASRSTLAARCDLEAERIMTVYASTIFDGPSTHVGDIDARGINDLDQIVGSYHDKDAAQPMA